MPSAATTALTARAAARRPRPRPPAQVAAAVRQVRGEPVPARVRSRTCRTPRLPPARPRLRQLRRLRPPGRLRLRASRTLPATSSKEPHAAKEPRSGLFLPVWHHKQPCATICLRTKKEPREGLLVSSAGSVVMLVLVAYGILYAADRVFRLALDLVHLAFGMGLGVTSSLADPFLHFALGLIGHAFDAIVVHSNLLFFATVGETTPASPPRSGRS